MRESIEIDATGQASFSLATTYEYFSDWLVIRTDAIRPFLTGSFSLCSGERHIHILPMRKKDHKQIIFAPIIITGKNGYLKEKDDAVVFTVTDRGEENIDVHCKINAWHDPVVRGVTLLLAEIERLWPE